MAGGKDSSEAVGAVEEREGGGLRLAFEATKETGGLGWYRELVT